jgi:hypothetical protein
MEFHTVKSYSYYRYIGITDIPGCGRIVYPYDVVHLVSNLKKYGVAMVVFEEY